MKVIFLDIDGVLNSAVGWNKLDQDDYSGIRFLQEDRYGQGSWVEDRLVRNLQLLIKSVDARVVGVSSWFTKRHDIEEVSKFLEIDIIDMTDYTGGGLERGRSIDRYVKSHNISHWVILDDSHKEHYDTYQMNNLVFVDGRLGLTKVDVEQAIEILGEE